MRRILPLIPVLLFACSAIYRSIPEAAIPTAQSTAVPLEAGPTHTPGPTAASPTGRGLEPTAEAPFAPGAPLVWLEVPEAAAGRDFEVQFLPDGALYVGDLVSLVVIPPEGFKTEVQNQERRLIVTRGGPGGPKLGEASFTTFGLGRRTQATLLWTWNTAAMPAGEQVLTFSIQPDGPLWNETVSLLPRGQLPPAEAGARWATAQNDCCLVHYITHSAAERDLPELLEMFDEQARDASRRMGVVLSEPVEVTLLPRLVGHGGFAASQITLSYLDRNYASGNAAIVFHHELIHILDAHLGGNLRPPFLVEGLAVYQSGGHFKPEPLLERAAALLPPEPGCVAIERIGEKQDGGRRGGEACGLDLYIPLAELMTDFYRQRHEIGYLESAALVEHMVETWGWNSFASFYRDIQTPTAQSKGEASFATAINSALQRHFGMGFEELEQQFKKRLEDQTPEPEIVEDVLLSLEHFDRVRAYQQSYDPSAYFLHAWLPDSELMRQRGIVADYMRSPDSPYHLALETLLASSDLRLQQANTAEASRLLEAVTSILSAESGINQQAFSSNPLAADYLALVEQVTRQGYRPEKVEIDDNKARVWVSISGPKIIEISFLQLEGEWYPLTALSSTHLTSRN